MAKKKSKAKKATETPQTVNVAGNTPPAMTVAENTLQTVTAAENTPQTLSTPADDKLVESVTRGLKGLKLRKATIHNEFAAYFGSESRLENWQRLCFDVGIELPPKSITQCKKALNGIWVNIYDLLDDVAANRRPVRRHESEIALAKYTRKKKKVYPKQMAKEGGPARALLAHIIGRE